MKRRMWMVFLLLGLTAFCLTGCASFQATPHPQGVNLGMLVGDVTYPNYVGLDTRFEFTSNDINILKVITSEGKSTNILGLFSSGDNGYGELWEKAQKLGADDVIGIKVDTRLQKYIGGFVTIATVRLTGIAIKYNK